MAKIKIKDNQSLHSVTYIVDEAEGKGIARYRDRIDYYESREEARQAVINQELEAYTINLVVVSMQRGILIDKRSS